MPLTEKDKKELEILDNPNVEFLSSSIGGAFSNLFDSASLKNRRMKVIYLRTKLRMEELRLDKEKDSQKYQEIKREEEKRFDDRFKLKEVPKEIPKKINSNVKFIILIIIIVVIFSFISSTKKDKQVNEIQAWVSIVSPDGKLSVDLPSNWKFNTYDQEPNTADQYYWTAKNQNGSVMYLVKYENYESSFKETNTDELSAIGKNTFLKSLADDVKKAPEYNVSNFSTEFINIKGYNAIKYTGFVSGANLNSNLEGYIILVGKSSYNISVLYVTGVNNEIDRILNSLIIK